MTAGVRGHVTGVLLAAGAGRRAGGPKVLRHDPDGVSWLRRSVTVLLDGGCADVVVVLGSAAVEAAVLLPENPRVRVVVAADWTDGMSRSLRAGLSAVEPAATAALVHLVDLPDVNAEVVWRVLTAHPIEPTSLLRATFGSRPGHPVLVGMEHLPEVSRDLDEGPADAGARHYLRQQHVTGVECGDLATGQDQDGLG